MYCTPRSTGWLAPSRPEARQTRAKPGYQRRFGSGGRFLLADGPISCKTLVDVTFLQTAWKAVVLGHIKRSLTRRTQSANSHEARSLESGIVPHMSVTTAEFGSE
ncbi:hypothetical protein AOLI_G00208670 [Acnodon oligacanthus]